MWPFGDPSASGGGPQRIDVVGRVRSPNDVPSPLSGRRAAFVHVEILERDPAPLGASPGAWLGEMIFGDVVTLEVETTPLHGRVSVDLVVRRAALRFAMFRGEPTPLDTVPPELVPMLARAVGRGGGLHWREHLVLQGDPLRLRAIAELRGAVLVLRDDLAPVELDEVLPGLSNQP